MPTHASLTDPELHEPKGVASASANTVYRATGAGSGSWGKVTTANLDTASILNINRTTISVLFPDIGTPSTVYIPVGSNANVTSVIGAIQTAVLGADTLITATNASGASMGTLTFPVAGSAAGNTQALSVLGSNVFTAGQSIRLSSDGAASNAVPALFVIELTYT